jgi:hypothetical protein
MELGKAVCFGTRRSVVAKLNEPDDYRSSAPEKFADILFYSIRRDDTEYNRSKQGGDNPWP